MADPASRERYALVVEALPSDTPAAVRLRSWLKRGLRSFNLKCVEAKEVAGDGAPAAPPAAGQEDMGS
jgi:hypothetical protein